MRLRGREKSRDDRRYAFVWMRQRAAARALLRNGFFRRAAAGLGGTLAADGSARRRNLPAGRGRGGRTALPRSPRAGTGPARGAVAALPAAPQSGEPQRRAHAVAP